MQEEREQENMPNTPEKGVGSEEQGINKGTHQGETGIDDFGEGGRGNREFLENDFGEEGV